MLAQAAIHGLGGIGKTQTAIEYAHRFGEHYRFVLWVVAEEESAIRSAYLSIARELELVEAHVDLELAVVAVKAWLSREDGWLLVFDNADHPALVRAYLPPIRMGGKVLLTSRAKSFADVGVIEPFRVETMDPEDAVAFLLKRTQRNEPGPAAELSEELGYLPLALDQAAAYADAVGVSLAAYLSSFQLRGLKLLEMGQPGADYPASVATTWNLSFTNIKRASPASAELLTVAAFLEPDSVPIEIFRRGRSELGGLLVQALKEAEKDPVVFWELLAPLERYSLVNRLSDTAFKLHRLTQEVIKDSLHENVRRSWAERVVRALNVAYPEVEFENWPLCERLQPNARWVSELSRTSVLGTAEAGRLFSKAGDFAWARGDLVGAKLFGELSLEILERTLGGEHPATLKLRSNLAAVLRARGDRRGAKELHEQILETQERLLGSVHPDTLTSRNNLAESLRALGYLAGARKLYEQTLEIRERVLGSEHVDSLISKNNLAETLCSLHDPASARPLQEQALEIERRMLGSEHPVTLSAMNNLALILHAEGDLKGARKLLQQTLELRERVLGSEHPDTAESTWALLWSGRQLNERDTDAQLHEKLRWLIDRDEDSISSAKLREIRLWLLEYFNPS